MRLASCLYLRSKDDAKGICANDAQVLKKVEEIIAQEFSFSFNIDAQEVGAYIQNKLNMAEPISK